MKTLAISIVLALGVSAPAFAQTAAKPPAPEIASDTASPDEAAIADATTPEDRARLLLRCAGPPPRPIASPIASKEAAKEPVSEPAVVEHASAGANGG